MEKFNKNIPVIQFYPEVIAMLPHQTQWNLCKTLLLMLPNKTKELNYKNIIKWNWKIEYFHLSMHMGSPTIQQTET